MIEISFGKLLVLALIALIVLGPEKLPAAARTAGALVRRLRGSWDSVRAEVERELQVDEIRRTAREAVARMDAAQAELDNTLAQVREVAAGATSDGQPAQLADGTDAAAGKPDQPHAVTVDTESGAADVPAETLTGDLFAGTPSRLPAATGAAAAASEPAHGAD
jgi:sec-independent protein translocase protein TatB